MTRFPNTLMLNHTIQLPIKKTSRQQKNKENIQNVPEWCGKISPVTSRRRHSLWRKTTLRSPPATGSTFNDKGMGKKVEKIGRREIRLGTVQDAQSTNSSAQCWEINIKNTELINIISQIKCTNLTCTLTTNSGGTPFTCVLILVHSSGMFTVLAKSSIRLLHRTKLTMYASVFIFVKVIHKVRQQKRRRV